MKVDPVGLREERLFVYWVTQVVYSVLEHLSTVIATEIHYYSSRDRELLKKNNKRNIIVREPAKNIQRRWGGGDYYYNYHLKMFESQGGLQ